MVSSWTWSIETLEYLQVDRALTAYFRRRAPEGEVQDLAADTWLAVVRWYRGRCSLRAFAFLVARKLVADLCRRRRSAAQPLDSADLRATSPGPESVLMLLADHDAVERALERVSESHRPVVRLWLAGHDNFQIAARLDIPYNTVRSRLSRGQAQALAALRELLDIS